MRTNFEISKLLHVIKTVRKLFLLCFFLEIMNKLKEVRILRNLTKQRKNEYLMIGRKKNIEKNHTDTN